MKERERERERGEHDVLVGLFEEETTEGKRVLENEKY
jgi:hypothetical protein